MTAARVHSEVEALIRRSNRLGSDRTITNYGGGNTSAKALMEDPVTGKPVRVLYVKGTGGDLGTLTAAGLASLVLDRVLALERLRTSGVHEDDIVGYLEHCRFDRGAVPSIDTSLHAFIDAPHIDHLHPDAVIALAVAADGERLVEECYAADVGWLSWKRPGFELALLLRDLVVHEPSLRGVVLGGHGLICWGNTSDECEATSRELVERAGAFLRRRGRPEPFGPARAGFAAIPAEERRRNGEALGPVIRGLCSRHGFAVADFNDAPVVLDFLASEAAPRLTALGTSCPDHFLRTKVRPLFLDLPPTEPLENRVTRLRELRQEYGATYRDYYETHADETSPPMRGDDPAIVLVPGVGMWSLGSDPQTARVAGEFYINAINVMRGAESLSSYQPIPDREKFRIEYWELEERKLRLKPPAPPLQGRVALVTGGASGIGRAIVERLAKSGACVVVADIDGEAAEKVASDLGREATLAVTVDVSDERQVSAAIGEAVGRFGGLDLVVNNAGIASAAPLVETSAEEWDRLHGVLARGSFLVSRVAARVMIAQGIGGDIVYVVSKNAVAAGSGNVAYGSAKADQAHQVRLLAAELGPLGIRVNGVNPDGVVRGSRIFQGDWLRQRAEAHGVEPERLGEYYASRTLLGAEVLPEHVADAVFSLVAGDLSRTTGLLVPVDGGIPAAFLR